MKNLFEEAKKTSTPKKVSSKPEKRTVVLKGKTASDLDDLAKLKMKIAKDTATAKVLEKSVKSHAIAEFTNIYNNEGDNPGSFNIESSKAEFMFVPTDRYLTIKKDRADVLAGKYEGIVTEETIFTLNAELVEKYSQVFSNLIMSSKKIADDDKAKLINAETLYSVTKGTINVLTDYNEEDVSEVLSDVNPIFQMKNIKLK